MLHKLCYFKKNNYLTINSVIMIDSPNPESPTECSCNATPHSCHWEDSAIRYTIEILDDLQIPVHKTQERFGEMKAGTTAPQLLYYLSIVSLVEGFRQSGANAGLNLTALRDYMESVPPAA